MRDTESIELLQERIKAARRQIPSDLVLKKGRVVNVFSGEILEKDVAVHHGVIVGVGEGYAGQQEEDINGGIVAPAFVDGHMHVESTMLLPSRLAAALLVHGTTAIVSDPHEIANVMGREGIRFMLRESEALPFDFFFMAPSCVPATSFVCACNLLGDFRGDFACRGPRSPARGTENPRACRDDELSRCPRSRGRSS